MLPTATTIFLTIIAINSCLFLSAESKKCHISAPTPTGTGTGGKDQTGTKTCQDYCCQAEDSELVYCCSDCKLSMEDSDCELQNYWRYIGYAIGSLAVLLLLIGLGFGAARLIKVLCCKKRSATVRTAGAAGAGGGGSTPAPPRYPRGSRSPPPPPSLMGRGDGWADQLPKKPPEYYEIFSAHPPPPYSESAV